MASRDQARGASKSLNKTIKEIMAFMNDVGERDNDIKLRSFLDEKIGNLAERWYRKGFNRAHTESNRAFLESDSVPKRLEFQCSRTLSPRQKRKLLLKSTIKTKNISGTAKLK